MTNTCSDCRYYLPVDVFQGICKISKQQILPEDPFCEAGERIPKCKYCVHFTPEKDHLGQCRQQALAYPDMIALLCTDFTWATRE